MLHNIEQCDNGQNGFAYRQNDLHQNPHMACPVDLSRLGQRIGNIVKGSAHDHDVENGDTQGQYDGPDRIEHFQIPNDHIGGDQTAVEKHREGDEKVDGFLEHQIFSRKTIGGQTGQHQPDGGAKDHIVNGVEIAAKNVAGFEYFFVPKERPLTKGPKHGPPVGVQQRRFAHGAADHMPDGDQTGQCDQRKNDRIEYAENFFTTCTHHVLFPPYHRLVSAALRLIALVSTTKIRLTTELNSPTAAPKL